MTERGDLEHAGILRLSLLDLHQGVGRDTGLCCEIAPRHAGGEPLGDEHLAETSAASGELRGSAYSHDRTLAVNIYF
ncbi:hypothetical protein GCM10027062_39590 [Nocardioides hungaricus]